MSSIDTFTSARIDALFASHGSVTAKDLGIDDEGLLAIARKRPDLEPIFLLRCRSRQGKTRIEEVRAYAWASQKIAFAHLGYRAEEARLLRLEVREPVPFPARLYSRFADKPKELEELRTSEKLYLKAMKQAPSKPGRAERDVLPLQTAFQKLGPDVAMDMWIDAAATFQQVDNAAYAAKMLGQLLRLVEKDKKVDESLLARTVLSAADNGVFNTKLYDFTWDLLKERHGVQTSLGFGLRVFRRLMKSGRALPTDFVKDMRNAAIRGKVEGFDALLESNVLWAAGLASFWNTSKKSSSWRSEKTSDHGETTLLRKQLAETWKRARALGDEGTRSEAWGRIGSLLPELSAYGRIVLVETMLGATGGDQPLGSDGARLLEAVLGMLVKPPRSDDRERQEQAADASFSVLRARAEDVLWASVPKLDEALRASSANLTSFVALVDLLGDVSDLLAPRTIDGSGERRTLLQALVGLDAAWGAALYARLERTEGKRKSSDDEEENGDDINVVPLIGEALAQLDPADPKAQERLAEIGPFFATKLAKDLVGGRSAVAWERVLGTFARFGAVAQGILTVATQDFVQRGRGANAYTNVQGFVHLLDAEVLREPCEMRGVVREVLDAARSTSMPGTSIELTKPVDELGKEARVLGAELAADGSYRVLWAKTRHSWSDDAEKIAIQKVVPMPDGATQSLGGSAGAKEALVKLWSSEKGVRVLMVKERNLSLLDADTLKSVAKATLGEDSWSQTYGRIFYLGRRFAMLTNNTTALVFGPGLEEVFELSTKGWGSWGLLEPKSGPPLVLRRSGAQLSDLFVDGKKAPALPAEVKSFVAAYTLEDGSFVIEANVKKGSRRHYRLIDGAWASTEAAPIEAGVVSFFDSSYESRPTTGDAYLGNDGRSVRTFSGEALATMPWAAGELAAVDLVRGTMIRGDALVSDASLPARIRAGKALLAARERPEDGPLLRAYYTDMAALASHVRATIGKEEAGKTAIEALGPLAEPVFLAAAEALSPLLKARLAVLVRVLGEVDTPALVTIPPHVAGVSRVEARRIARTRFSDPLDALAFWALDGDAKDLVLARLFAEPERPAADAYRTAVSFLGVAQAESTSEALATRALAVAEGIAARLADPDAIYAVDAPVLSPLEADDDSLSIGSLPWTLPQGSSDFPVASPGFAAEKKKHGSFPYAADVEGRRKKADEWLTSDFLAAFGAASASLVATEGAFQGDRGRYRVQYAWGTARFGFDLDLLTTSDNFSWAIASLFGRGTRTEWERFFATLEAAAHANGFEQPLVTTSTVPRSRLVAALTSGIAFTRASRTQRSLFRPLEWPAPEKVKGVDDSRGARLVMLTWLFGQLRSEDAGTTDANLEKIAKASPLVTKNWRGLAPKGDDDAKRSAAFTWALFEGFSTNQGHDIVLYRSPVELLAAFDAEHGARKGAK